MTCVLAVAGVQVSVPPPVAMRLLLPAAKLVGVLASLLDGFVPPRAFTEPVGDKLKQAEEDLDHLHQQLHISDRTPGDQWLAPAGPGLRLQAAS